MRKFKTCICIWVFICSFGRVHGQSEQHKTVYPRITGHIGIVHPLLTVADGKSTYNFNGSYSVSFVAAINLWKTEKWGFSLESFPTIKTENGVSKVTNYTFHPGVLYRVNPSTSLAGRLAFETSGRFGVTPVFTKIFKKNPFSNYYIAIPMPIRFGAEKPVSATLAFQVGVSF